MSYLQDVVVKEKECDHSLSYLPANLVKSFLTRSGRIDWKSDTKDEMRLLTIFELEAGGRKPWLVQRAAVNSDDMKTNGCLCSSNRA